MRMNKYILLGALSLVSLSSFAVESDWSGFYVGGNVGEAINSSNDQTILSSDGGVASADYVSAFNVMGNQTLDFNNFIAGVQSGYNYQIDHWVMGFEVMYDPATQASGSQTASVPTSNPNAYTGSGTTTITQTIYQNWNFTVGPRLGYAIHHFLFYVMGGYALSSINYTSQVNWGSGTVNLYNDNTTLRKALSGWAAGAGVEWQFIPKHWSVNATYLYEGFEHFNELSLVSDNPDQLPEPDPSASFNHKGAFNSNVLTLGINYLF